MTPQKLDKAALEAAQRHPFAQTISPSVVELLVSAYLASLPPDPARALVKEAAETLEFNALHLVAEDDKADALLTVEHMRGVMREAASSLQSIKDADHERD